MRALRVLWRSLRNRCPHCGDASIYRGVWDMHETCPSCGMRFETEEGAWIGAMVLGYTIGAAVAIALVIVEVLWHPIAEVGLPVEWTIVAAALVATLLGYRTAKSVWFALLYYYGFMAEEPPRGVRR